MTFASLRRRRALLPLNIAVLGALAAGTLLLARPAQTQNDPTSDLVLYRTALDQVAAGKSKYARLLLENSGQNRLAPESAALLAYLQEKDGDEGAARDTLDRVAAPSAMTLAYKRRLGTPVRAPRGNAAPANTTGFVSGFVPAAAGGARLNSTDARLTRLEDVMFRIVNAERKRNGLSELAYDTRMAEVARAHSAEMRDKKYFAHESPTAGLKDPLDRYSAGIGATPRIVAENIYRAWGNRSFLDDADIQSAHSSLMNSPGHRANILQPGVTRIGIGLATDSTGNIWLTQLFARPQ